MARACCQALSEQARHSLSEHMPLFVPHMQPSIPTAFLQTQMSAHGRQDDLHGKDGREGVGADLLEPLAICQSCRPRPSRLAGMQIPRGVCHCAAEWFHHIIALRLAIFMMPGAWPLCTRMFDPIQFVRAGWSRRDMGSLGVLSTCRAAARFALPR